MADGMNRRDFLAVIGVTGAGVATAACGGDRPENFLPYVRPAEDVVPGLPTFYTTTCRECPAGCGLHVETHEGRATKVEGNPDHPVSHGNTCARGQASVQGLYHPDRVQGPFIRERGVGGQQRDVSWSVAERELATAIRAAGAGGVAMLTGGYRGTLAGLMDDFARATGARRVTYAPLEDAPRDLRFDGADVLVSFGADFLETWGSPVDYAHQYAAMKSFKAAVPAERAPRFVWVGPHRPLTGLNADLWIDAKPGTEALVAQALAGRVPLETAAQEAGVKVEKLQRAMEWWRAATRPVAMGPGAAVAGSKAELRRAVDALNGRGSAPATDLRPVQQLIADMNANRIKVLLISGVDPLHSLPAGMGFAAALAKVPTVVSFSSFPDDTTAKATHVLPDHHFLEAWDDYNPHGDVWALVQPTMRPVFNTKQVGDVLLSVAASLGLPTAAATYYDYLRAAWNGRAGGETAWRDALKRGGVWGTAPAAPAPAAPPAAAAAPYRPATWEGPAGGLQLVVYPSLRFFDGRNANRPWLLELPDPVTKVPWHGYVELNPANATALGVVQGDTVKLESPHGAIELPVYVWPGVREGVVAVQMGLGHEHFGRYTQGVGANPMRLLGGQLDADGALAPATRVSVTKVASNPGGFLGRVTGGGWNGMFEQGVRIQHDRAISQAVSWSALAAMGDHGMMIPGMQEEREELRTGGGFGPAGDHSDPSSYPRAGTQYGEYNEGNTRWGMTIDLARCIGCAACVVACNAENNIPVVGPKEMARGRELHWLRIERYFGVGRDVAEAYTDTATDDVRFLPMLCQHCGNAPCEPVCPVYAAYHTPDGLNGQVYNRCVGTRYCANNCPYKVRVFNWFTYEFASPLHLQLNPDVTVREKGVMEKCTFCVQRIHEVERRANVEDRAVRDTEVMPACAQACPTEVFTFGNFQDPNSTVSRTARSNRSYQALGELNTQPGIVYLKKVTIHDHPRNGGHADAHPAPFGGDEHTPQGGTAAPAGGH